LSFDIYKAALFCAVVIAGTLQGSFFIVRDVVKGGNLL
jgi:hypothetical protein